MISKKRTILVLYFFAILGIISMIVALNYLVPHFYTVTGKALDTENISIITKERFINIASPEAETYYFGDKIKPPYILDLNVSANFVVDSWRYTLIDSKHGRIVREDIPFTPNITIEVGQWGNKLIVYAEDNEGNSANDSTEFFISVSNSAPIIEDLAPKIFVCEGSPISYSFSVKDIDEERNIGAIEAYIKPQEIFYINPTSYWPSNGESLLKFKIISGNLNKNDAGGIGAGSKTYERTIFVNDGQFVDSEQIEITVIETNNPPAIQPIGVKTKILGGEKNKIIDYKVNVDDVEDGNQDSGNLVFNINFSGQHLFDIDSQGGMKFTPDSSHLGTHNVTVCVTDKGIINPSEKIFAVCKKYGRSITSCDDFSLTVTEENKQPTIIEYTPANLDLNVIGTDVISFSLDMYDPDGTPLDIYWYVDNELKKYTSGFNRGGLDEFEYIFGCGISKGHVVKAEVTDGLLTDSVQWDLDVNFVECTPSVIEKGTEIVGGCSEKWVCNTWGICQNANKSLEIGLLSEEDYKSIRRGCLIKEWEESQCGFQIRECFDLNYCNSSSSEPLKMQDCFYIRNPSCDDDIKNCHDGDCEILVDCWGPCPPCPTCFDGIKNQGEKEIDCGGPCLRYCGEDEKPFEIKIPTRYILMVLAILLGVLIVMKLFKIFKIKNEIKEVV